MIRFNDVDKNLRFQTLWVSEWMRTIIQLYSQKQGHYYSALAADQTLVDWRSISLYILYSVSLANYYYYFFFLWPCWKCKWTVWVEMEGEFGDKSQSFEAGWKWGWRIEVKNDKNRDEHSFCHWQHGDQSCGWREWETEIERESTAKWRDQQVLTL